MSYTNFLKSLSFIKKWSFRLILLCLLVISLLMIYLWLWEIPSTAALRHPEIKTASEVYDTKGKFIGLYQAEYRSIITFREINPNVKLCLLAVEDSRFYEHHGIDVKAIFRVLIKTILLRDQQAGGGSTITQQLAKQLYKRPNMKNRFWPTKTFLLFKSKLKEWIIAYKLENIYSKNDILTMYLNKFEFINGAHGIDAAAKTYFGKTQKDLNMAEAATLVGMLKNPSMYNPVRFPNLVFKRRNEVLAKLSEQKKIDLSSFKNSKLDMSAYKRRTYIDTIVPYFKTELAKYISTLIQENNLKKPDGTYYDIYGDGLRIETTIDLGLQRYAEAASAEHMAWIQKWYNYDWVNKNPWTYGANENEKQLRMASLEQRAKASTRYEILAKRYLLPALIEAEVNFSEKEVAILVMSETMPGVLDKLSKGKQDQLIKFRKSKKYTLLKTAYDSLQQAYRTSFGTKISMEVYDHKLGTKKVIMSPMDSVKYHASLLQTALVAIDPHNGHVKCWNGGLNYKYFQFDHVTSRRSIGSTVKPFLYTAAMVNKGIKPCDQFKDIPYSIMPGEGDFKNKEPWHPENATKINTTLMYNLYHGLLYSKNSITVKLLKELGSVEPLRDLLDKMGISKNEKLPNGRLAVPQLPSIGLGAVDITLLQLTAAYTTFANNGIFRKPILIKRISDKTGKTLYQAEQHTNKAIDALHNAIMLDMLINNESGEFSMHLKSANGGKTGTTDDQCDGWFIGLTPNLVVGTWTGGDDKWIRFIRDDVGQGFFTARPVFEKFIKKLEADGSGLYDSKARFVEPPKGFKELTNCIKIKTEPLPEFLRPKKPTDDSLKVKLPLVDSLKLETK